MLSYASELTPDDNDTLLETCPALPEVTTFGHDEADARRHAIDAIEEALAARLADGRELPLPVEPADRGCHVELPSLIALKVLLWHALRDAGITRAELARRLDWHREQVDRLFRIDHASKLDQLDAAFNALGTRLTLSASRAPRAAAMNAR